MDNEPKEIKPFSERKDNGGTPPKLITYNGITDSLRGWSKRLGWRQGTIGRRLASGWSIEKALTTPVNKDVKKSKLIPAKQLRDSFKRDLFQVYMKNRHHFRDWLQAEFEKDPARAIKEFIMPNLPKQTINDEGDKKDDKAIVRIAIVNNEGARARVNISETEQIGDGSEAN